MIVLPEPSRWGLACNICGDVRDLITRVDEADPSMESTIKMQEQQAQGTVAPASGADGVGVVENRLGDDPVGLVVSHSGSVEPKLPMDALSLIHI